MSMSGPTAPPRTGGSTLWVWLIVFLPLLPLVLLLFVPWGSMFAFDIDDPRSVIAGSLDVILSPFYGGAVVSSYLIYGLSVFFAFRDARELRARGVSRPFHWAFSFLGGIVYAIGRSVVVVRRTGKGYAPIWIEGVVVVISVVVTAVICAMVLGGMAGLFEQVRR